MITQYPDFSILEIHHKKEIESLVSGFDPYSDFNFVSLFCWNVDGSTKIATLNNNLVIKMPDYISGDTICSLIGRADIDSSIDTLLQEYRVLKLVPEAVVNTVNSSGRFLATEDRDNFDYIYSLPELVELRGSSYKKKRNKLNSVTKNLVSYEFRVHSKRLDSATKEALETVFIDWAGQSKQTDDEIAAEKKAFTRILENWDHLELVLATLLVEDRIVGFSINEVLDREFAINHFEKTLPVHDNIALLLVNRVADDLVKKGCKYVNWEQDLGLDGLRQSKSSYQPISFLKKFIIKSTN